MIPDALWQHPDLEPIDIKVWCALMLHARDRAETTSTNGSIAATAETSMPTLKRSLARLVKTGFVQVDGVKSNRVLRLCPDAHVVVFSLRMAHG